MKIDVSVDVLNWAIERSQVPKDSLIAKSPKLLKWLNNEEQPTFKQLEKFAHSVYLSTPILLLKEPLEESPPIVDFRTGHEYIRYSPHLLDTIYDCQFKQDWYKEFSLQSGEDPVPFVSQYVIDDDPVEVAHDLSKIFNFAFNQHSTSYADAFAKRKQALEDRGVLVLISGTVKGNTHRPLDINEFRGFALSDVHAPLIFINARDSVAARSFTLLHELAHVTLGNSGISKAEIIEENISGILNDSKIEKLHKIEQWCNAVAAEILAPQDNIFSLHITNPSIDTINGLSQKFRVSTLVILRRLRDLDIIGSDTFWQMVHNEQEKIDNYLKNHKKSGGGDFYNTKFASISKQFLRALAVSTLEGRTTYRDAMDLANVATIQTFKKIITKVLEDE